LKSKLQLVWSCAQKNKLKLELQQAAAFAGCPGARAVPARSTRARQKMPGFSNAIFANHALRVGTARAPSKQCAFACFIFSATLRGILLDKENAKEHKSPSVIKAQ
jgi:hypothetical protein